MVAAYSSLLKKTFKPILNIFHCKYVLIKMKLLDSMKELLQKSSVDHILDYQSSLVYHSTKWQLLIRIKHSSRVTCSMTFTYKHSTVPAISFEPMPTSSSTSKTSVVQFSKRDDISSLKGKTLKNTAGHFFSS